MKTEVKTRTGQIMKMQRTEVGTLPNGDEILALTDYAGPAVVIKGANTHLLGPMLESHEIAVLVGQFILAAGTPDIYPGWCDLRTASSGEQLLRVFCGI